MPPRHLFFVPLILTLVGCGSVREQRWADGSVRSRGAVEQRQQTGPWEYFHPNGTRAAAGDYLADEQQGPWQAWHEDGSRSWAGRYQQGQRDGWWWRWHPGGRLQSVGAYDRDRQDGPWAFATRAGRREAEGAFRRGALHLAWRWFDERDHEERSGLYWDGLAVGPWREGRRWHERGAPAGFTVDQWRAEDGRPRRWQAVHPDGRELLATWDQRGDLRLARGRDGEREDLLVWDDAGRLRLGRTTRPGWGAEILWAADGAILATGDGDAGNRVLRDAAAADGGDQLAQIDRLVTARLADLATPVPSPPTDAEAAPTAPAPTPSPVAEATLPTPAEVETQAALTPIFTTPGFWTVDEEDRLGELLQLYQTGTVPQTGRYADDLDSEPDYPDRRPDLTGRPLPQTRFLAADGRVVDLADFRGRPVLLVILRGFAGQVCLYCSAQTRVLSQMAGEFAALECPVLFCYPGPASSVPVFLEAVASVGGTGDHEPTILLDLDLGLVAGLDIAATLAKPTSIILDHSGAIRYAYVGKDLVDRPAGDVLLAKVREIAGEAAR